MYIESIRWIEKIDKFGKHPQNYYWVNKKIFFAVIWLTQKRIDQKINKLRIW